MKHSRSNIRQSRLAKISPFLVLGILSKDCFLGGGSLRTLIRSEEVSDYDLFFREKPFIVKVKEFDPVFDFNATSQSTSLEYEYSEEVKRVCAILEKEKFKLIFKCPEGKLFTYFKDGMKVQLILEAWGEPEQVIDCFDFNACRAAMDDSFVYADKYFVRDIKMQRLTAHRITYPVASMKRLIKYANKGYNVNDACLEMVKQISMTLFNEEQLRLYID